MIVHQFVHSLWARLESFYNLLQCRYIYVWKCFLAILNILNFEHFDLGFRIWTSEREALPAEYQRKLSHVDWWLEKRGFGPVLPVLFCAFCEGTDSLPHLKVEDGSPWWGGKGRGREEKGHAWRRRRGGGARLRLTSWPTPGDGGGEGTIILL